MEKTNVFNSTQNTFLRSGKKKTSVTLKHDKKVNKCGQTPSSPKPWVYR